jgi:hypothetical protein
MKRDGIDVVLMDLQNAPRVTERRAYPDMETLIADIADHEHVGLYRRFALMQYWQSSHAADAPPMIGSDGLHMTDAGYGCLAADLANALEANWHSEQKIAQRARTSTNAIVGLPAQPAAVQRTAPAATPMRRNDATPFN